MQTELFVTARNVYGNDLIYPACDQSRRIADLLNTKTFTLRQRHHMKAIGFTFTVRTSCGVM